MPVPSPPNSAIRTAPRAVDVTDEDSVRALFDDAGALDVVVNTAGFSGVGLITELPVEDFRSVVDVCLTGSASW